MSALLRPDDATRLDRDNPDVTRLYEQTGIIQFHHGTSLIALLGLKPGERVLDIGAGTGRLAAFVASLVGPSGRVFGIDPLDHRIEFARRRQSPLLSFEIGVADDLSRFQDAQFDAVYLNSVFHWIADKGGALREIHRVLKPGGRLALNTQDPSRPHQSRRLMRSAILAAGLGDRYDESRSARGSTEEELETLFKTTGFVDHNSDLRSFVDVFSDTESLFEWSDASTFGNFLDVLSTSERDRVRSAFASLVESQRTPQGLRLERPLRFSFGRKPTADTSLTILH